MKVFEYTNKGSREENQDYVVHGSLSEESCAFVVADGMGGYSEGAMASKVVGDALLDFIELNYTSFEPAILLKEAISFANDALMLKRIALGVSKMGCVVTVLFITKGYAYLSWLGDSRIYMYRDGKEVYRTEDHSVINELAKIRSLVSSSYDKYASVVTKSIMGDVPVDVAPIRKVKIEKGDIFILCTDGLHKELDMTRVVDYNENKKDDFDSFAPRVSDNFSFIKIEV